MDASFQLAANIVGVSYEDLPPEVRDVTKKSILDTLSAILAGSTAESACKEIVELVKEGGGKEESNIIAYGGKVPAWMAAFANGAMSHAADYDDVHDEAKCHPSAHTVPAALAAAQRAGKVDGKEFITAVAAGIDVVCRLGFALTEPMSEIDWFLPVVLGTFSSTAAAGRLLGLSKEQVVSAFGIAIHQAAGSKEMGSDIKSVIRAIRDAFSAKAGVLSALMAQRGITGVENSLEGKAGLFNLYFKGEYDPRRLTDALGKRFEGVNVSFKPWPACRGSHSYIDATLHLVREHDIKPQDIGEITAVVDANRKPLCEPLEARRKPALSIHAKLNIPFPVAVAVARRQVVIGDFLPEALKDPKVLQIAEKVNYRFDPQLKGAPGTLPAIVEIKTKDGKRYSKRVDYPYGSPQNPLSMEDLVAKFRDCARYSARPISKDKVDRVIQLVTELENVPNVGQVIQLIS
jgi:2-methylcitrate dehydratase PrpD